MKLLEIIVNGLEELNWIASPLKVILQVASGHNNSSAIQSSRGKEISFKFTLLYIPVFYLMKAYIQIIVRRPCLAAFQFSQSIFT